MTPANPAPATPRTPSWLLDPYETLLSPDEEQKFQEWRKSSVNPRDSGQDYDFRGAWKANLESAVSPADGLPHWSDQFKKPNHPTFSNESQYAKDRPDLAGSWGGPDGETYTPPQVGPPAPPEVDQGYLPAAQFPAAGQPHWLEPDPAPPQVQAKLYETLRGSYDGSWTNGMDAETIEVGRQWLENSSKGKPEDPVDWAKLNRSFTAGAATNLTPAQRVVEDFLGGAADSIREKVEGTAAMARGNLTGETPKPPEPTPSDVRIEKKNPLDEIRELPITERFTNPRFLSDLFGRAAVDMAPMMLGAKEGAVLGAAAPVPPSMKPLTAGLGAAAGAGFATIASSLGQNYLETAREHPDWNHQQMFDRAWSLSEAEGGVAAVLLPISNVLPFKGLASNLLFQMATQTTASVAGNEVRNQIKDQPIWTNATETAVTGALFAPLVAHGVFRGQGGKAPDAGLFSADIAPEGALGYKPGRTSEARSQKAAWDKFVYEAKTASRTFWNEEAGAFDINKTKEKWFTPDELSLNPKEFQYKRSNPATGVTGRLSAEREWSKEQSYGDPIYVFQTKDGKNEVADGHQRTDLAKRAQAAGQAGVEMRAIVFREEDGWTRRDIMQEAAWRNIRAESGTPFDVAKLAHTLGVSVEKLIEDKNVSPGNALARDAKGLQHLGPETIDRALNSDLPAAPTYYGALGRMVRDVDLQLTIANELERAKPKNLQAAIDLIELAKDSAVEDADDGGQESLFGPAPKVSRLKNEMDLLTAAKSEILGTAKAATTVNKNQDLLEELGNTVATSSNAAAAMAAKGHGAWIAGMGSKPGPIRDVMRAIDGSVARGEMSFDQGVDALVAETKAMHQAKVDPFRSSPESNAIVAKYGGKPVAPKLVAPEGFMDAVERAFRFKAEKSGAQGMTIEEVFNGAINSLPPGTTLQDFVEMVDEWQRTPGASLASGAQVRFPNSTAAKEKGGQLKAKSGESYYGIAFSDIDPESRTLTPAQEKIVEKIREITRQSDELNTQLQASPSVRGMKRAEVESSKLEGEVQYLKSRLPNWWRMSMLDGQEAGTGDLFGAKPKPPESDSVQAFGPEPGSKRDIPGDMFHVTLASSVPGIRKEGIVPLKPSNWVKSGTGERYGDGQIFTFTNKADAVRWAGKMDFDLHGAMGTGKVFVLDLYGEDGLENWQVDSADPLGQAGNRGKWMKRNAGVRPENIIRGYPVTSDIIRSVIAEENQRTESAARQLSDDGYPPNVTANPEVQSTLRPADSAPKKEPGRETISSFFKKMIPPYGPGEGNPGYVDGDLLVTVDGEYDPDIQTDTFSVSIAQDGWITDESKGALSTSPAHVDRVVELLTQASDSTGIDLTFPGEEIGGRDDSRGVSIITAALTKHGFVRQTEGEPDEDGLGTTDSMVYTPGAMAELDEARDSTVRSMRKAGGGFRSGPSGDRLREVERVLGGTGQEDGRFDGPWSYERVTGDEWRALVVQNLEEKGVESVMPIDVLDDFGFERKFIVIGGKDGILFDPDSAAAFEGHTFGEGLLDLADPFDAMVATELYGSVFGYDWQINDAVLEAAKTGYLDDGDGDLSLVPNRPAVLTPQEVERTVYFDASTKERRPGGGYFYVIKLADGRNYDTIPKGATGRDAEPNPIVFQTPSRALLKQEAARLSAEYGKPDMPPFAVALQKYGDPSEEFDPPIKYARSINGITVDAWGSSDLDPGSADRVSIRSDGKMAPKSLAEVLEVVKAAAHDSGLSVSVYGYGSGISVKGGENAAIKVLEAAGFTVVDSRSRDTKDYVYDPKGKKAPGVQQTSKPTPEGSKTTRAKTQEAAIEKKEGGKKPAPKSKPSTGRELVLYDPINGGPDTSIPKEKYTGTPEQVQRLREAIHGLLGSDDSQFGPMMVFGVEGTSFYFKNPEDAARMAVDRGSPAIYIHATADFPNTDFTKDNTFRDQKLVNPIEFFAKHNVFTSNVKPKAIANVPLDDLGAISRVGTRAKQNSGKSGKGTRVPPQQPGARTFGTKDPRFSDSFRRKLLQRLRNQLGGGGAAGGGEPPIPTTPSEVFWDASYWLEGISDSVKGAFRFYAKPLVEAIEESDTVSGPGFARRIRMAVSEQKRLYGIWQADPNASRLLSDMRGSPFKPGGKTLSREGWKIDKTNRNTRAEANEWVAFPWDPASGTSTLVGFGTTKMAYLVEDPLRTFIDRGQPFSDDALEMVSPSDELKDWAVRWRQFMLKTGTDIANVTHDNGEEIETRKILLRDGTVADFKPHPEGMIFMRMSTPEFFAIMDAQSGPLWDALAEAIASLPVNDMDVFEARKAMKNLRSQSLEKLTGTEHAREIKMMPHYIDVRIPRRGVTRIQLFVTDPLAAAQSMMRKESMRAGYTHAFGQNFGDGRSFGERYASTWAAEMNGDAELAAGVVRVMNGLPYSKPRLIAKPGTRLWEALIAAKRVTTFLNMSLLGMAAIPNLPEPIAKTPAMIGNREVLRAYRNLITNPAYRAQALEETARLGTRTVEHLDMMLDPYRPYASALRMAGQVPAAPARSVNEMNELAAATAAMEAVRRLENGGATMFDKARMRKLGFTAEEIGLMEAGNPRGGGGTLPATRNPALDRLYRDLGSRMVAAVTGSTNHPVELSRMANSRLGTWLWPFQRYAQITANDFRRSARLIRSDIETFGPWSKETMASAALAVEEVVGHAAAGWMTMMILAFIGYGLAGARDFMRKTKERPFEVVIDSFRQATMGLPFQLAIRAGSTGSSEDMAAEVVKSTTPGRLAMEFTAYLRGTGKYKDLSGGRGFAKLVDAYAPITDFAVRMGAMVGLIREDAEREVALKAYWDWRRRNMGVGRYSAGTDPADGVIASQEKASAFREASRKVRDAIDSGATRDDIRELLVQAALAGKEKPDWKGIDLAKSLRGMRVLPPIGLENQTMLRDLRKFVGEENFKQLELHDEMLNDAAKGWLDIK